MATCPPCEAKELLNQGAARAQDENHKLARQVAKMVRKDELTADEAEVILGPLMDADRATISHQRLAVEKASQAFAAAKDLRE